MVSGSFVIAFWSGVVDSEDGIYNFYKDAFVFEEGPEGAMQGFRLGIDMPRMQQRSIESEI